MTTYQCYLRDQLGIVTLEIIESTCDDEANRRAREILNDDRYRTVEVWNGAQQVSVFPSDAEQSIFAVMMRIALMQE